MLTCMATTISIRDGIEYGFGLLAYAFGVGLAGGSLLLIGILLARGGGVLALFGGANGDSGIRGNIRWGAWYYV